MRQVRLHPHAIEEVQAAWRRYRDLHQDLADDFVVRFDRALAVVAARPESFALGSEGARRCRVARFPYVLFFIVSDRSIDIVAVAHTRRRPDYWRPRRMR